MILLEKIIIIAKILNYVELSAYLEEFLPISAPFSVSHVTKDDVLQEAHIYLTISTLDLPTHCVVHSDYERT